MSVFRKLVAGAAVVLATGLLSAVPGAGASAVLPTAAVAVGDSFISGEGAGNYQNVTDVQGVSQAFPGWSAANSNAYFCHRSANASINKATLPGIQNRYNIACSGGKPADIATNSIARDKGRNVTAQLTQLRAIAQTNDIDVVLVGLGSNNSSFTFGDVAIGCATRFAADAWTGWWEFWAYLNGPVEQEPCTDDDLATTAEFASATSETTAALRQLLTTLDEIDADGQHRVVFQDYTNPLPFDVATDYLTEADAVGDERDDTRDKFRALGSERYEAGCPIHRASLAPGHTFSTRLGGLVNAAFTTLRAEYPGDDLQYLNVQQAFDGARLCEKNGSPANALASPIRLQDGATGTFLTTLDGFDKIDIQRIANACVSYYQTCQESWHPNAAGHAVLGQCLSAAVASTTRSVKCVRNSTTGALTVS
ncbi:GDSL-type esterase/lipase family protein [Actinocorallia aurea]